MGQILFCSIGNFSEFSYRRTNLRGMRTTRIKKMAAAAAALRRECASGRTLFYSIGNFSEFSYRIKTLRGMRTTRKRKMATVAAALRRECASRRTLFLFDQENFGAGSAGKIFLVCRKNVTSRYRRQRCRWHSRSRILCRCPERSPLRYPTRGHCWRHRYNRQRPGSFHPLRHDVPE